MFSPWASGEEGEFSNTGIAAVICHELALMAEFQERIRSIFRLEKLRASRGFASHVKGIAWLFLTVRAFVAVSGGYCSMKPVRKLQCKETDAF